MTDSLGPPNLTVANLKIWIHDREYPASEDFWDGNWLKVTIQCATTWSSVMARGSILHLSELKDFAGKVERLYETLDGKVELDCLERNLRIEMRAMKLGNIEVKISLSQDHLSEKHEFLSQIDQSYLSHIVRNCKNIMKAYPLRGQLDRR